MSKWDYLLEALITCRYKIILKFWADELELVWMGKTFGDLPYLSNEER